MAYGDVAAIDQDGPWHLVRTGEAGYRARSVIITGGADHNQLGVPGEERLTGRGVSYCATCDAAFFRDQEVAVRRRRRCRDRRGRVHRAVCEQECTSSHRRGELRASAILQERARSDPKIDFILNTVVEEVLGDETVSGVRLRNVVTGGTSELAVAGVFVFIGLTPNTAYLRDKLLLDAGGHIPVNEWMETGIPACTQRATSGRARRARR